MSSVLDFTNNDILEQWKIRTVVYPSGKPGIPLSPALVYTRAVVKGSRYENTASPLTPWIYGILDFCNVRVNPFPRIKFSTDFFHISFMDAQIFIDPPLSSWHNETQ